MKLTELQFLLIAVFIFQFSSLTFAGSENQNNRKQKLITENKDQDLNNPPVAVNDTFIFPVFNTESILLGNLLENDYDPENDEFVLTFLYAPKSGEMTVNCEGTFTYSNQGNIKDTVCTKYIICEKENPENCGEAEIVIVIKNDHDNDGIADEYDLDDDNDGILDIDETTEADTDEDGILNHLDIDSDGDGIPDNIEAQKEGYYIQPLWTDSDYDGWDDAYDPDTNGSYFILADTDEDGTPDFLDMNSDDDAISDLIEATVTNPQLKEITPLYSDQDQDGLDDIFDLIEGYTYFDNPIGSNVPLPDSDENGVRDWRDFLGEEVTPGDDNLQAGKLKFTLYPNPTRQKFSIEIFSFDNEENTFLEVYSISGKLLFRQKIDNNNPEINPGKLNTGQYLVMLKNNNISIARHLIISN